MNKRDGLVKERAFHCIGGSSVVPPNAFPNVGPGDALKGTLLGLGKGVHESFCVVFGWKCVKKRDGLVKEHAFHCIGGGGAKPLVSCQMLGRAMRQKVHHLALAEVCTDLYVSFLVGIVWQNV